MDANFRTGDIPFQTFAAKFGAMFFLHKNYFRSWLSLLSIYTARIFFHYQINLSIVPVSQAGKINLKIFEF